MATRRKATHRRRRLRIVFVDIDGVLSGLAYYRRVLKTPKPRTRYDCWKEAIDRRAVMRLNRIVRETGAHVVISSSWRKSHPLHRLRKLFYDRGFVGRILGVTPLVAGELRGRECVAWLATHRHPVWSFVALDDQEQDFDPIMDRLVLTTTKCSDGLRNAHVDIAVAILNVSAERRVASWRSAARGRTAQGSMPRAPRLCPAASDRP